MNSSLTAKIKNIILNLLSDHQPHTLYEIKNFTLSNNIPSDKIDSNIQNALFQLKKENPRIESISRGIYQLSAYDTSYDTNVPAELENADKIIRKYLEEYLTFKWYDSSDDEIAQARINSKVLFKLRDELIKMK